MHRLSNDARSQVVACLCEGNSIRATVRMTGVSKKTVARLAEATNGTARTLRGIVSTLAPAFGRLWQEWERAGGLSADRFCFMQGLYDGMMLETRASGQPLPARNVQPIRKRGGKSKLAAPGIGVHPYSVASVAGRQLRFMVPIDAVERELKESITRQIE